MILTALFEPISLESGVGDTQMGLLGESGVGDTQMGFLGESGVSDTQMGLLGGL